MTFFPEPLSYLPRPMAAPAIPARTFNPGANPMSSIRIHGHDFPLTERYAEGHTLTATEAAALNQVHRENTGNNHRAKIKEHIDGGTFDLEAYRKTMSDSHDAYEFGARRVSARIPADPVEAEAVRLATIAVKAAIAKQGLTNVAAEVIKAQVEKALNDETNGAKLRKMAAANVKALEGLTGDEGAVTSAVAAEVQSGPKRTRKAKGEGEAAAA